MGFKLPFIRDVSGDTVKKEVAVGLTALGKTKAESFAHEGPRFDILQALSEGGPMTLGELCEETHMSPDKVKRIVKIMIRSGYIKRMDS